MSPLRLSLPGQVFGEPRETASSNQLLKPVAKKEKAEWPFGMGTERKELRFGFKPCSASRRNLGDPSAPAVLSLVEGALALCLWVHRVLRPAEQVSQPSPHSVMAAQGKKLGSSPLWWLNNGP